MDLNFDLTIFLIQFVFGLIVYGVFAWIFFLPKLRLTPRQRALMILTAPHAFRYLGLYALAQNAYNPALGKVWADSTAYGDLATQVAAVIALVSLNKNWGIAIPFVWICNLLGLYAFGDSTLKMLSPQLPVHFLAAGWFLPAFYVPLLVWSHILLTLVLIGRPKNLTA